MAHHDMIFAKNRVSLFNLYVRRAPKAHLRLIATLALVLLAAPAFAKVEFDSNQLMMKNADQISDLVRRKINKAHDIQAKQEENDDAPFMAEPEAIEQLKDAMRIVLARPDQDGTRANAFARLRRELIDLQAMDKVLEELTSESIAALKSDVTSTIRAGTYIVLLENMMAEMKPEISSNESFKKLVLQIRDADVKISDKVRNQQLLRSMSRPQSPSETAAKIIPKQKK